MNLVKKRVVITGLGAVTPLGNSVGETWEGLLAGRSGIGLITKFDCRNYETRIAGELKQFDPLTFIPKKESRRYDDFIIYSLAAAAMARADAELKDFHPERAGVMIGSAIGGLSTMEREKISLSVNGPGKMSPFVIPSALCNLAAGQVAIKHGAQGPIGCSVTACAAGTNAIGDAARIIERGDAEVMFCGGAEAAICSLAVAGFNAMRAISTLNEEPPKASRPFDAKRDGFVISEGAGILVLEEANHARKRGARIYAELAGYASTADAYHMAAPPPGHAGAARCMALALADAGVSIEEVDYINAHGTSTAINDLYETEAIKNTFGAHAQRLAVSSTKSMLGHMLGAAGGIEAIIAAMVIHEGIIPPTINLDCPDPECDLDYVPHQARQANVKIALSNSFGFGGANGVLVFKKWREGKT
jgi:3-oxoacyl-[acyl-carrier-protein] synthase II